MARQQRFALDAAQSPTHFNLHQHLLQKGWATSRFTWRAGFSDYNLGFHVAAAQQLEYKHLLAELVKQYCPHIMPLTYSINDDNWREVLKQLPQLPLWILKPSLLNNGQHIKLFCSISDLAAHYATNQRLGGAHVIQQYLHSPHLLRGEHKYSIRVFVILSNYDGTYVYQQGYFNVAKHPYTTQVVDLRPHLTNEHLSTEDSNVIQIPSVRFDFFMKQYEQIKYSLTMVLQGLQQCFPLAFSVQKSRQLAIFGFDFMADNAGKIWLLEANHGPCFPIAADHPLQVHLYANFWHALISSFIAPIAANTPLEKIDYSGFDRVL